jgi:NTE family protein
MFAIVLSGGGNHGALEAGALEILMHAGLRPSLWVGTSAGGLNAINMACNPTMEGARQLQDQWRQARPIPSSYSGLFTVAQQFIRGKDSFFPNESMADFVSRHIPRGMNTFGDVHARMGARALTVSMEYPTGIPRIFGDKPEDRLLDGTMASSAFPIFFPPWQVGESRYIDGGLYANLPVRVAVEYGADTILAIEVHGSLTMIQGSGIVDIASFTIASLLKQQTARQLEWARHEGARVHYLCLDAGEVMGWDFNQADQLIEIGKQTARAFLQDQPDILGKPTLRWIVRRLLRRGPKIKKPWKISTRGMILP